MNVFEYIKEKHNLINNIKGIDYINSLEKEIENLIQFSEERDEYVDYLKEENQLLYGRLNNIIALAEKKIKL